jgi:predicted methyltransferase
MKNALCLLAVVGALEIACGGLAVPSYAAPSKSIADAVADSGRPAGDTARDANRHPAELLAFAGVKPGMKVVDLLPGGGYFTRIFAKAVGPKGFVYAYYSSASDERLRKQGKDPDNQGADLKKAYPNVGVVHGPLQSFVTPEKVDLVWTSDNFHDLHNNGGAETLPAALKGIHDSLKPGGVFIVIDHRAAKGAGAGVTSTLHRMDEDIAKQEVEAAGFKLVGESDVLKRDGDDRSKKVFEAGEHDQTDQFVLKFRRK